MSYKKTNKIDTTSVQEDENKKQETQTVEPKISTMSVNEPSAASDVEVSTPESSTDKTEDIPEESPVSPEEPTEDDAQKTEIKTNWAQVCCAMTQYPGMA